MLIVSTNRQFFLWVILFPLGDDTDVLSGQQIAEDVDLNDDCNVSYEDQVIPVDMSSFKGSKEFIERGKVCLLPRPDICLILAVYPQGAGTRNLRSLENVIGQGRGIVCEYVSSDMIVPDIQPCRALSTIEYSPIHRISQGGPGGRPHRQ